MPLFEVTATAGEKVTVHASATRDMDWLVQAFERTHPPVGYDIVRAEHGADMITTQSALDTVLAQHPQLKRELGKANGAPGVGEGGRGGYGGGGGR